MSISRYLLFLVLPIFIYGCSGNEALQSRFAADPSLTTEEQTNGQGENNVTLTLPDDFPDDIPIYEGAQLTSIDGNTFTWTSTDPANLIIDAYERGLRAFDWQVERGEDDSLVGVKEDEAVTVTMNFEIRGEETIFSLTDSRLASDTTNQEESPSGDDEEEQETPEVTSSEPLEQLVQVGVIEEGRESVNGSQEITRRQYARWLVKTNNVIFGSNDGKSIRLASANSEAVFRDVANDDPDFPYIQGLANAGLIPSRLTNNPDAIAFNPDQPLTREDLILWKVPFDFRQSFPTTTLDNIRETWGFQDANQMSPELWQKLYIDWQNGDNANIRRTFGFTTLFQPQKTVTMEEAAITLNRFGYQGDVRSLEQL
ncbi:S-layer region-like precursor [Cyanobacterium stanieri PCC 7202]|uniref:S-layer region-like n=1 Tax=Cyanobacterium stanieri (strain ATCC 29140 / PCC 7202) TaxID=292563 RepID=K9YKQ1_CYASC|nr:S-layer region-like precursor [Cyanobacterium stanieri PCC 7202]